MTAAVDALPLELMEALRSGRLSREQAQAIYRCGEGGGRFCIAVADPATGQAAKPVGRCESSGALDPIGHAAALAQEQLQEQRASSSRSPAGSPGALPGAARADQSPESPPPETMSALWRPRPAPASPHPLGILKTFRRRSHRSPYTGSIDPSPLVPALQQAGGAGGDGGVAPCLDS